MKTGGEIFWENVTDCLEYYDYSNAKLARLMCATTKFGVYKKNVGSVENSLSRFMRERTMPDNIWLMGIRDAIRIIDTDNKGCQVDYSDLLYPKIYKE